MTKTTILASIYEMQGLKKEALKIYEDVYKKDAENIEAKIAIRRLTSKQKEYTANNKKMLEFFHSMKSDNEVKEFERWLMKIKIGE